MGQITFTTGYTVFNVKKDLRQMLGLETYNARIIPLLFGYRHNMKGVYVEPQLGLCIASAKAAAGGTSVTESEEAFSWGFCGDMPGKMVSILV